MIRSYFATLTLVAGLGLISGCSCCQKLCCKRCRSDCCPPSTCASPCCPPCSCASPCCPPGVGCYSSPGCDSCAPGCGSGCGSGYYGGCSEGPCCNGPLNGTCCGRYNSVASYGDQGGPLLDAPARDVVLPPGSDVSLPPANNVGEPPVTAVPPPAPGPGYSVPPLAPPPRLVPEPQAAPSPYAPTRSWPRLLSALDQ
jgi:hypothetical protein